MGVFWTPLREQHIKSGCHLNENAGEACAEHTNKHLFKFGLLDFIYFEQILKSSFYLILISKLFCGSLVIKTNLRPLRTCIKEIKKEMMSV